jgi:NAD(P)-dependent dehydrogenase (short-subunit alcohol dehydrogenase family)
MGERLKSRNAVVTGAGRGIGRAVALALAEEGANIVVCDLGCASNGTGADKAPANEVVEECRKLGVKAVPHYGDVSDFKAAEDMIKTCVGNFGRIDILCNIAGNFRLNMIFNMSEEEWDKVIAVHLKGTFNLTRHATPLMKQQRYGRIINCTSTAYYVRVPIVGHANYVAAKGGIVSLTYATAREMGQYGVTCNALSPKARTRLADQWGDKGVKGRLVLQELVDQRGGWTEEATDASYFAPFAAYLASDAAANINGCIFYAEAGKLGIHSRPEIVAEITRDWRKEGRWSFDDIEKLVPGKLLVGYVNPAPPQAEEK